MRRPVAALRLAGPLAPVPHRKNSERVPFWEVNWDPSVPRVGSRRSQFGPALRSQRVVKHRAGPVYLGNRTAGSNSAPPAT